MSIEDLNYQRILDRVSQVSSPSIGITPDKTELGEPSQSGDKIIIRQNNIIIEQLIDIRQLLNTFVIQQGKIQESPDFLEKISQQISKLSLGFSGQEHQRIKRTVYSGPRLKWKKIE